ncbi:phosphosulfolactate synthase [Agrobacterium vitis]|uniref:phosphosulfolactate synthase n=1 Tax=Agrobacterium vitis TaxID=373 RepID=UPI002034243C|nr:phosphosulfolactate synthase [Agrobacterium vitis]
MNRISDNSKATHSKKEGIKMTLEPVSMAEAFPVPTFEPKPRGLHQTWLKDVGFDEAPYYVERMGLIELEDFLSVAGERLDYVKVATRQVIEHPEAWVRRKVELYQRFGVEPYLDHSYFHYAYQQGSVEKAIEAGRTRGFKAIEFMNTFGDVPEATWKSWRRVAVENEMKFLFEFHPERNWRDTAKDVASTGEEIIRNAAPFIDDGAFAILIDHEELEFQEERMKDEIGKVIDRFGLDKLIFEVTSPKEGPTRWKEDLTRYFSTFGGSINVANIMPSQAMYVEVLRLNAAR